MFKYDVSVKVGRMGIVSIHEFDLSYASDPFSLIAATLKETFRINDESDLNEIESNDWRICETDTERNISREMHVNAESNEIVRLNLHHFLCLRFNITDTAPHEISPEPVVNVDELMALIEV